MLIKGFLKPYISIEKIGEIQFWTGIIFGVISAFVFIIYFNYARELFRSLIFILIKNLKKAFDTDSLVSLDTLILESIVIQNKSIQNEFLKRYRYSGKGII